MSIIDKLDQLNIKSDKKFNDDIENIKQLLLLTTYILKFNNFQFYVHFYNLNKKLKRIYLVLSHDYWLTTVKKTYELELQEPEWVSESIFPWLKANNLVNCKLTGQFILCYEDNTLEHLKPSFIISSASRVI